MGGRYKDITCPGCKSKVTVDYRSRRCPPCQSAYTKKNNVKRTKNWRKRTWKPTIVRCHDCGGDFEGHGNRKYCDKCLPTHKYNFDPVKRKATRRRWFLNNKDKHAESCRKWRVANPEASSEIRKRCYYKGKRIRIEERIRELEARLGVLSG